MSESCIDQKFGRVAFGDDPGSYHATRPGYPDWVFETLRDRCHLAPGTATFEIGAGTGTATRRMLDFGANPLRAIEFQASAWSLVLDPDQTVALYATFSNINIRPDREAILAELGRIARDEFHGRVTRNMTTSLYTARRRSDRPSRGLSDDPITGTRRMLAS